MMFRARRRAALCTLASSPAPPTATASSSSSSSQKPPVTPLPPQQSPATTKTATTASSCTPETVRRRHVFKVAGYSLLKGLGAGKFVRSATFAVGGYDWFVRYCPDGDACSDCVAVFVALMTKGVEVRALFDVRLVNLVTGGLSPAVGTGTPSLFNDVGWSWGYQMFQKRQVLEASEYLRDDCLVIQCDVTVIMGTPVPQSETMPDIAQALLCDTKVSPSDIKAPLCAIQGVQERSSGNQAPAPYSDTEASPPYDDIQVPPSKHLDNLKNLFDEVKPADVKVTVKGQDFHAHKSVLASRSPMLIELELGHEFDCTIILDMEPDVFKALLHFIYTDTLPAEDGLECSNKRKTVEGLLVAADRLALDRLKLISRRRVRASCRASLAVAATSLTVATPPRRASPHHCHRVAWPHLTTDATSPHLATTLWRRRCDEEARRRLRGAVEEEAR
nr:unnamed protein product [Digitaria exilis]